MGYYNSPCDKRGPGPGFCDQDYCKPHPPECPPGPPHFPGQPCPPPCPPPFPGQPCPPPCPPPFPGQPCPPPPPGPLPPPIKPLGCVPGMNVQEQLNYMGGRVNECIDRWNQIQQNCYEAMNMAVGAAKSNGVYYDCPTVRYEEGYSDVDGCPFSMVSVMPCDKAGRPVRVQLVCAYNNTTNSGMRQPIDEVSYLTNAQVIMSAIEPDFWVGQAIANGYPISKKEGVGQILGILHNGAMRVFEASTPLEILRKNGVVSSIGPVTPIVMNGVETPEAKADVTARAFTVIGWKPVSGETVFLWCGDYEVPGCTPSAISTILRNMGVTIAVITSNTAGAEYMGRYTVTPKDFVAPTAPAYWIVSKRPNDGWCNDWSSEVAEVIQTMGHIQNDMGMLESHVKELAEDVNNSGGNFNELGDRVTYVENKLTELESRIFDSTSGLTAQLNAEVERAERAETELGERIDALGGSSGNIEAKLNAEISRAKEAESGLGQRITDEIQRATSEELRIENESKERDNTERERAKAAEAALDAASKAEDKRLSDKIATLEENTGADVAGLNKAISDEADRAKAAESRLSEEMHDWEDKLADEQRTRADQDSTLLQAINQEQTRAISVEDTLRNLANSAVDLSNAASQGAVNNAENISHLQDDYHALEQHVQTIEEGEDRNNQLMGALAEHMAEYDKTLDSLKADHTRLQQNVDDNNRAVDAIRDGLNTEIDRATKTEQALAGRITAEVKSETDRAVKTEQALESHIRELSAKVTEVDYFTADEVQASWDAVFGTN